MKALEKMTAEEIARAAHDLDENTIGKLTIKGRSIAENRTAMALVKNCCPPGCPPFAFATALLIGMAIADAFQERDNSLITTTIQ